MRSNTRRRLRYPSVSLLSLALVAAACGDGDDEATYEPRRRPRPRPPRARRGHRCRRRARRARRRRRGGGQRHGLLEPGPRPAQRPGRRLRGRVRDPVEVVRASTATSSPGRDRARHQHLGRRPRGDQAPSSPWRPRAGRRQAGSTRRPARRSPASVTTTPSSTSTTATSSRSAPPCSPSPGTPTSTPTASPTTPTCSIPRSPAARSACIDPAVGPAVVDFYLWLGGEFGEDFVDDLAAQEPRIYPSSLPIGEALASGEISPPRRPRAARARPRRRGPPSTSGSPTSGAWGARYFGCHPQVVRQPERRPCSPTSWSPPRARRLVQGASGSVLPGHPRAR